MILPIHEGTRHGVFLQIQLILLILSNDYYFVFVQTPNIILFRREP